MIAQPETIEAAIKRTTIYQHDRQADSKHEARILNKLEKAYEQAVINLSFKSKKQLEPVAAHAA